MMNERDAEELITALEGRFENAQNIDVTEFATELSRISKMSPTFSPNWTPSIMKKDDDRNMSDFPLLTTIHKRQQSNNDDDVRDLFLFKGDEEGEYDEVNQE